MKFKIDDPPYAFPLHCTAVAWGAIVGDLFNSESYMETAVFTGLHGAFFCGGGRRFGANFLALGIVAVCTSVLIGVL